MFIASVAYQAGARIACGVADGKTDGDAATSDGDADGVLEERVGDDVGDGSTWVLAGVWIGLDEHAPIDRKTKIATNALLKSALGNPSWRRCAWLVHL